MTSFIPSRGGRRGAAALAAALAALALTACGSDPAASGDAEAGKGLFSSGCGSCHTLADAGTTGTIGPNLDDAFRQAKQDGWEHSEIRAIVREWMELAEEPMPRDVYEGQEAVDVATYVAEAAGSTPESSVRAPRDINTPKSVDPTSADEERGGQPQTGGGGSGPSTTEPRAPSEEKGQPEGGEGD